MAAWVAVNKLRGMYACLIAVAFPDISEGACKRGFRRSPTLVPLEANWCSVQREKGASRVTEYRLSDFPQRSLEPITHYQNAGGIIKFHRIPARGAGQHPSGCLGCAKSSEQT